MRQIFLPIIAAALLAAASAPAAPIQETYASFTASGVGSASAPGFTFDYLAGPPNATLVTNGVGKLPGTADNNYLTQAGDVFDWWQFNNAAGVALPSGVLQFSIAVKVNSFAGTSADNEIDLITFESTAGAISPVHSITVDDLSGTPTIRTADSLLGSAFTVSGSAFDPAATGSNWLGDWHILAGRVDFVNGAESYWDIPQSGTPVALGTRTGATTSAAPTIQRFTAGGLLVYAAPQGGAGLSVSLDNATIYPDSYASDAAFLTGVKSANGFATAVADWSCFN